MRKLFLIGIILISFSTSAQELLSKNLEIDLPNGINKLLEYKKACIQDPPPPTKEFCNGIRLQVFYGKNREKAEDVLKKLKKTYPNYYSNLIFAAPDYKVQLGFFKSRKDGQKLLNKLKKEYDLPMLINDKFRCTLLK